MGSSLGLGSSLGDGSSERVGSDGEIDADPIALETCDRIASRLSSEHAVNTTETARIATRTHRFIGR
jgi:hypothetical protein